MSVFAEPGSTGELPADYVEWQRGVVHTIRPSLVGSLVSGREYRISFTVRDKCAAGDAGYGHLYRAARSLARARMQEIVACHGGPVHVWIDKQGWRSVPLGDAHLRFAVLVVGVRVPAAREVLPEGLVEPGAEDLLEAQEHTGTIAAQDLDEVYSVFDHAPSSAGSGVILFSYGESISERTVADFAPYIHRAEARAKFYLDHCRGNRPGLDEVQIVKRHWWSVTDPNLVTVHVYLTYPEALIIADAAA